MKRTLDGFLISSRQKIPKPANESESATDEQSDTNNASSKPRSNHPTYPFPVPQYPRSIVEGLGFVPVSEPRVINDQPDLDLAYYSPYIPSHVQKRLFEFLRRELFFYRVRYQIKRGPVETQIVTPRYTTVFGVDQTSYFSSCSPNPAPSDPSLSDPVLLDSTTATPIPKDRYRCSPRPLPQCLDFLRTITEAATSETFNFCLVNYYASGADSISYHSDDERFLGPDPAIASLSLGASRDFLMKHKTLNPISSASESNGARRKREEEIREADTKSAKPLKLSLASGDMVLMRGKTQTRWLHSIPKRRGPGTDSGRINVTFRKALAKSGTENYYQYNVGGGGPFKWNEERREMMPWPENK